MSHKRQLPLMPKKIGAVTSLSGAAVRDIINVLSRRYPIGKLYAVNTVVQGEEAPDSICKGILRAAAGCDLIIVGRGGGSSEDLSAFNTAKVAYAIYNCKVPVISAVGHETDFTIADMAADLRAPTPSAAAELAVPSADNLKERINILERRLRNAALGIIDRAGEQYISLNSRLSAYSPENRLKLNHERLLSMDKRAEQAFSRYIEFRRGQLAEKIAKLDSLSPLKVLSRGYSLVYNKSGIVNDAEKLKSGDYVTIKFDKGEADALIIDKR